MMWRRAVLVAALTGALAMPGAAQESAEDISAANAAVVEAYRAGEYRRATDLARRALESAEATLGPEHPDTLTSVNNLAALYRATGRHVEAEPLFRRALEASERVLGPEHPDTLVSVNNLAGLYRATGRHVEAEPLFRRALEASERVLGPEHPSTLRSVNNLAFLYQATGRHAAAEPLLRRALEGFERVLGPEHPDTLQSVNNLAALYDTTGRYVEAEPLYRRALEARERVLGPEHPDTLVSVNNLAGLYHSTGRHAEAEPLYRRALEASERVLGPEHPDTLISVNNLAGLHHSTGRYAEAEPLFRRALEASERVLGPEHPDTLVSVNNLALLYDSTGRYVEAEPLYRRALEASERVLGPEHPNTLTSLGNLAELLVRTGRPDEALHALRTLDLRLGQWLDTEVRTARAATERRRALRLQSVYQDAGFSLALLAPSGAASAFAADLALKWKKRLAQDDAVLNNIARVSDDPALLAAVGAVRAGRRALSNVAFDDTVPAAEKTRLREALEAAEAGLRAASDKYRRFLAARTADASDLQLTLKPGEALVEYRFFRPYDFEAGTFGDTRLLAIVLRAGAAPGLVDLGDARGVLDLQAGVVDADRRAAAGEAFADLMRRGHERLVAPLRPHLAQVETLYIAPDGPLAAVPFEALRDTAGRPLIEAVAVRMLQTGRDLVARDRPATGQGLVAFGGVDFGAIETASAETATAETDTAETAADPLAPGAPTPEVRAALDATRARFADFSPLAATLEEVRYIGEAYAAFRPDEPAPVVLTGADATEAAVKSLAAPPRVLHFATHGYYLESGSVDGRPLLQSGITLAGANRALRGATGADGENGILHAVEAQTLNLYGTELVVLSACDTGQGAVDYSEGLEGLPRAFYVAGAKAVLVALWPVGDTAARDFMQRFYDRWLAQPISDPAAALRQTKLWYLAQADPALSDPQTWTPFVLFEG